MLAAQLIPCKQEDFESRSLETDQPETKERDYPDNQTVKTTINKPYPCTLDLPISFRCHYS